MLKTSRLAAACLPALLLGLVACQSKETQAKLEQLTTVSTERDRLMQEMADNARLMSQIGAELARVQVPSKQLHVSRESPMRAARDSVIQRIHYIATKVNDSETRLRENERRIRALTVLSDSLRATLDSTLANFQNMLESQKATIASLTEQVTQLAAANAALADELRPLTKAAQSGALDARQRSQIVAAIRAVPETGFDWGQAMWYEEIAGEVAITEMGKAANPAAYYKELMETPAPENFTVPKAAEIAAYRKFMNSVEEALRLPPDAASERLKTLQDSAKTLHPFFRDSIPSLTRINDARIETQAARQKLLQAVAAK